MDCGALLADISGRCMQRAAAVWLDLPHTILLPPMHTGRLPSTCWTQKEQSWGTGSKAYATTRGARMASGWCRTGRGAACACAARLCKHTRYAALHPCCAAACVLQPWTGLPCHAVCLSMQCFAVFDDARCRGSDLKLRRQAVGLLTLGPGLCKDKLMQAAGRMRQLERGQALALVFTQDIESKIRTANPSLAQVLPHRLQGQGCLCPTLFLRCFCRALRLQQCMCCSGSWQTLLRAPRQACCSGLSRGCSLQMQRASQVCTSSCSCLALCQPIQV
jgi:hypothetical protein